MNRIYSSDKTLQIISPLIQDFGITRLIDLTKLDKIGIPCYSATRPMGRAISVSCGKGRTHPDAKVSALMESIEVYFAENPDTSLIDVYSEAQLKELGQSYIELGGIIQSNSSIRQDIISHRNTNNQLMEWFPGVEMISNEYTYIPACLTFYIEPYAHLWTSNGLASGNNLDEALLHALYELIERDAFATFIQSVKKSLTKISIIDPQTCPKEIQTILSNYSNAGIDVYILYLPSCIAVTTILCVSLSDDELTKQLQVNLGLGTSLDPVTAAYRAITECAQSRLALIHGAREDLYWPVELSMSDLHHASNMRALIESCIPHQLIGWDQLTNMSPQHYYEEPQEGKSKVASIKSKVSNLLSSIGHSKQYYTKLTDSDYGFCVVKLFIPSLKLDSDSMGI